MKKTRRLTAILAIVLGFFGICVLFKWEDKVDGYLEAHEYLHQNIRDGDAASVRSWFRDPANREWGIRINERLNSDVHHEDSTWLMTATEVGRVEIVKALLDAGADVNMRVKNGHTALSIAKQKGFSDIAQMLVAAGAKE